MAHIRRDAFIPRLAAHRGCDSTHPPPASWPARRCRARPAPPPATFPRRWHPIPRP